MKSFLAGAGIAAVAGMLMGAAAKPDLGWDDRPAGPQIMAGWGGGRSTGPFDDGAASFASYKGQLPDYVLGTDWKTSLAPPAMTAEPNRSAAEERRAEARYARNDELPDLPVTQAAYQEPPHAPISYPSMDGGAPHGSDLLPPAHADDGGATPTG